MNTSLDTLSVVGTELTPEQLDKATGGIAPIVVLGVSYALEFAAWLVE